MIRFHKMSIIKSGICAVPLKLSCQRCHQWSPPYSRRHLSCGDQWITEWVNEWMTWLQVSLERNKTSAIGKRRCKLRTLLRRQNLIRCSDRVALNTRLDSFKIGYPFQYPSGTWFFKYRKVWPLIRYTSVHKRRKIGLEFWPIRLGIATHPVHLTFWHCWLDVFPSVLQMQQRQRGLYLI